MRGVTNYVNKVTCFFVVGKLNPQLLNICMAICGMYMLWAHNETLAHVVAFVVVLLPVVYFGSFLTHRSGFIAISFGIGCLLLWFFVFFFVYVC